MAHKNPHLAIIGDRAALAWVLREQRIAFPEPRYRNAFPHLDENDQLYLYTTRNCYKNPGRDRGLVISRARVVSEMTRTEEPRVVGDRELPLEASLDVEALAPARDGIDLAATVPQLTSFPKPDAWAIYLRRSLFRLTEHDATLFDQQLKNHVGQREHNLEGYLQRAHSPRVSQSRA